MRVMQLQKRLMALAGVAMFFYLIFHMLTNLTFFSQGQFERFYTWYNEGWARALVLFGFTLLIAVHVRTALKIRRVNAAARTIDYHRHKGFHIPARYVTASILFLLGFIVIHIVQTLSFDTANAYQEMIGLFDSFWMLLFYLAGLFVLTMHLQHSMANVLQTLGKTAFTCKYMAWAVALTVSGGLALPAIYSYFFLS